MNRRVAYQGEPGAFSELAARRYAVAEALLPCRRFEDVFAALATGAAHRALVPYVNSIAGPVTASCALLAREPVRVVDEVVLPISQALLALPGVALPELRYVLSHPVALRQCRRFLRQHPWLEAVEVDDTAGAISAIRAEGKRDSAALASAHAAELYGAEILANAVQDSSDNRTTFLLIEAAA